MKKLLAVLLALVMLVSLAACADNTDKDNPSSDAPANSDNPSMKANVNKKIAMIMQQGGLGDQGFNDTAYAGLMTCKEKYDLDVNAVECTDTTQGETLIRELCEAGYGLIINLEAGISGNMYTVARDYESRWKMDELPYLPSDVLPCRPYAGIVQPKKDMGFICAICS